MKNFKRKVLVFSALSLSTMSGFAFAVAPNMGDLVNSNVDIGSLSTVATTIAGSAITMAGLVAAARVGKRLIGAL